MNQPLKSLGFNKRWKEQNCSIWSKESFDYQVFLYEIKITTKLNVNDLKLALTVWLKENLSRFEARIGLDNI